MNKKRDIDTGSGISPLGPSRKVKASIRKAVKSLGEFPDAESLRLRRFFESKYGLPEKGIIFGNSLKELVFQATSALKAKKVLIIGPSLSIYEEASLASGSEVYHLSGSEETGFALDSETLKSHCEGVDLVFLAEPNRITGRLMDRTVMNGLLKFTADKKVTVLIDESLRGFTGQEGHLRDVSSLRNLIVVSTTALFYGLPGLELAYAAASPSLVAALTEKKRCDLNALAQEAAWTALRDKTYAKLATGYARDEKKLFVSALGRIRGITCLESDSNMFLIKTDGHAEELILAMKKEGFPLRDCRDIGGLGENFFSIAVMAHDHNKKFVRIVKEVKEKKPAS